MKSDKEKHLCEVILVKGIQKKLLNVLFSCQNIESEEAKEFVKKSFEILNSKSAEILVYTQILLKIRDELVFSKLDLERVNGNEESKEFKRVKWLESRMQYLSLICHRKCFQLEVNLSEEVIQLVQKDISPVLRSLFHQTTKESLFKSCKCNVSATAEEEKSFRQMQGLINEVISTSCNFNRSRSISCITEDFPEISSTDNVDLKESKKELKTFSCYQEAALENLILKLQSLYSENETATQSVPNETKVKMKSSRQEIGKNMEMRTNTISFLPAVKSKSPNVATSGSSEIFADLPRITKDVPVVKEVKHIYPRSPSIWCDKNEKVIDLVTSDCKDDLITPSRIPSGYHHLNYHTNNQLLQPNDTKEQSAKSSIKRAVVRVKAVNKLKKYFQSAEPERTGMETFKNDRIQRLYGEHGLGSSNANIAIDAAKSAGKLKSSHPKIIGALKKLVVDEKSVWLLKYEAAKSLLLLGDWQDDVLSFLSSVLETGNNKLKADVIECIRNSKNGQYLAKSSSSVVEFCNTLTSLVKQDVGLDLRLRVEAALCLAHLCVKSAEAKQLLLDTLQQSDEKIKGMALLALIKQLNMKSPYIINALMYQLKNARCWKLRMEAAGLFQVLSLKDVKNTGYNEIFEVLQELLWNHPSQEFRRSIAGLLEQFDMKDDAYKIVLRKLEDREESVRAEGIISLATLQVKSDKELKILLDIFELDSSTYVRTQVIRTFTALQWNHPRVIRALLERQRGASTFLAQEASKALKILLPNQTAVPTPSQG